MTTAAIETLRAAMAQALAAPAGAGFPHLAKTLLTYGVHLVEWVLPAAQATYVTNEGTVVQLGEPVVVGMYDVPDFDEDALLAALRTDQAGGFTLPEFLAAAWAAGCVRYVVDLDDRVVVYEGAAGETYTQEYPDVDL